MFAAVVVATLAAAPSPEARAVLKKYECHRCHEVEGLSPPPKAKQCAGCHLELSTADDDPARRAAGHATYGPAFDRFVARTRTLYVDVPPLWNLSRFRASWFTAYLRAPRDLRPHLTESMPRLPLTPRELDTLVAGLGLSDDSGPPPTWTPELEARATRLFEEKACASCHLFGARRFKGQPAEHFTRARPANTSWARAPDLLHARERLRQRDVVKLLLDPRSVNPRAVMPNLGLSKPDAELLAGFVMGAPIKVEPPAPRVLAKAPGAPRYEDVEARVFRKVCWHCHSNAELAGGDGGPGNTGGFGFKGAGLSFASYDEVMNGSVGPDGAHRSIFRKGVTGAPVLLEVLRARVDENRSDLVEPGQAPAPPTTRAVLGMPLGLPALTPDDLALVEAWVAAGRPRPAPKPVDLEGPLGISPGNE